MADPAHSSATVTAAPVIFEGPIDITRKKDELIANCKALNLSTKDAQNKSLKRADLIARLNGRLFQDNPTLENDPIYAPLYKYKRDHQPKESKSSKNTKKTSAQKVIEDAVEQGQPQKPLTG